MLKLAINFLCGNGISKTLTNLPKCSTFPFQGQWPTIHNASAIDFAPGTAHFGHFDAITFSNSAPSARL
jgi:hypothetical protein